MKNQKYYLRELFGYFILLFNRAYCPVSSSVSLRLIVYVSKTLRRQQSSSAAAAGAATAAATASSVP